MYLNEHEGAVIGTFYRNIGNYADDIMRLIWSDGSCITAKYLTVFEDWNELNCNDPKYEEYVSIGFEAYNIVGNPPVEVTKDCCFCINYRNFPDGIYVDGEKIS